MLRTFPTWKNRSMQSFHEAKSIKLSSFPTSILVGRQSASNARSPLKSSRYSPWTHLPPLTTIRSPSKFAFQGFNFQHSLTKQPRRVKSGSIHHKNFVASFTEPSFLNTTSFPQYPPRKHQYHRDFHLDSTPKSGSCLVTLVSFLSLRIKSGQRKRIAKPQVLTNTKTNSGVSRPREQQQQCFTATKVRFPLHLLWVSGELMMNSSDE
jgi:hypothetical protein